MTAPLSLSLVIPAFNESATLPALLERCSRGLLSPGVELLVVDNGSTDATPELLEGLLPAYPQARSVRVPQNLGYGYGILAGLKAARGDILGWTHADLQTPPEDALRGLRLFGEATNPTLLFVKGLRHGRPLADAFFTVGMALFETVMLGSRLWDINAQPTLFHRSFYQAWNQPPHDFSLDLFAFYMARARGLAVRRFPVEFGQRAHGLSRWNIDWRAKMKFIGRTLDYSFKLRRSLSESP